MNILVIGNGFDLAHGFPTKYADFLEFCKVMKQIVDFGVPDEKIDYGEVNDEIIVLIKNGLKTIDRAEWKNLIYENLWIKYFLWNPMYQKENWIDFESEISKVIRSMDNDMLIDEDKKCDIQNVVYELSNDFLGKIYKEYMYMYQAVNESTVSEKKKITFKEIRDRLYADLNKLIRALELYLVEYVDKMQCKVISPDLDGIYPDSILSFNYTHNYSKIYDEQGFCKYDYIHGEAREESSIINNNMVLGIDEYLDDDRKDNDIDFIAFKKFYQRIYKGTGCLYQEWVESFKVKGMIMNRSTKVFTEDGKNKILRSQAEYHNVYIYGHSLDDTDKDVLRALILNDKVKTTIYYNKTYDDTGNHDNGLKSLGEKIANLVKVIGQDELIKRTGGSKKTIVFKLQEDMIGKKG